MVSIRWQLSAFHKNKWLHLHELYKFITIRCSISSGFYVLQITKIHSLLIEPFSEYQFSTRHYSTWWTAASTPQTLLVGSTCGPLAVFVPQHRCSMFGRRAFSMAGPAAWNSLPDYLRDPTHSFDSFHSDFKTFLFLIY